MFFVHALLLISSVFDLVFVDYKKRILITNQGVKTIYRKSVLFGIEY